MKISIIVPVGNLEEWRRCETSIHESIAAYQGPVEADVLACYDLEHKGAYLARNEGLKRATGEWIAWVDCDDLVERAWFGTIAEALREHGDCDVIQFDATEVKNGPKRRLKYTKVGIVTGEEFAIELLRGDGMPAWLWTRVFRKDVFEGESFSGRVKQDYRMFLCVLPRIHKVWSIGQPLYRYLRHGHGLSSYTQRMDYRTTGAEFFRLLMRLPSRWQKTARLGLTLTLADVAVHTVGDCGARYWVWRSILIALFDTRLAFRLKVKCLLACMGMRY